MNSKKAEAGLVWDAPTVKRGRKPFGQKAMDAAELKRRSRERGRASGEREFLVKINSLHLEYIEKMALAENISLSAALRKVLDAAMDRFVGVVRRTERMLDNGASDQEAEKFMADHLYPELPPIEESKVESSII
jgi:hypothetical protein